MRLVVVGSGVAGAACAYAASGLGADVVLVDAGLPGQATAAGAGIICPWTAGADPVWHAFACRAAREYPDLIAGLAAAGEPDVSYRQVGALVLAADDDCAARECERLRAACAAMPEAGPIEVLDAGQARESFPPLREGLPAVRVGGAARVDGRRLAGALARAASRAGAEIRPGRAELALTAGRVTGVLIDGNHLPADEVVAAAGAWTAQLTAPAGVTVRVAPQRGQIAHIRLETAGTGGWPVVLPSGSGHYLLAFGDSRVVAGATREAGSGFDVRVTPGGLHEVLDHALAVAPGLAAGSLTETRVGLRPASEDGRPLLGRALPGLVIATGLGASGLTLGPLAGAVAARVALGMAPGADIAAFDPLR